MKHFLSIFLVCILTITSTAQTVPSARTVDWSLAGYQGTIPNPTQIADVTTFGAVGDGVTNDHAAIIAAKNSLTGMGVLYFPPGNYYVNNEINASGDIIFRGAGADSSMISFDLSGGVQNCMNIGAAQSGDFQSVRSGFTKGSFKLVVDSVHQFTAGGFCEILQDNGAWDTNPAIWAEESVGQIFKISAISGDTLIIASALRIDYDSLLSPRCRIVNPAENVGIECLAIKRVDDPMGNSGYTLHMNYVINSWFIGMESHKAAGAHMLALRCSNLHISGCYFHDAWSFTGSSTKGYGLVLAEHSGECLIENNVFRRLRHAMMVKEGANGNVFAYNYSREPNRSEFPSNAGADISLHGHFAYANLFEGNIHQNLVIDQAWGPSGPDNLFFRNREDLYGIIITSGSVQSNDQMFVGNEVTNNGPFLGNYSLVGTGHFEHGNNIKGTATPAGTSNLPDQSYYLTSAPSFWNIASSWPSIGYPNTINTGDIPARDRWNNGPSITECSAPSTSINSQESGSSEISIYPTPSQGRVFIVGQEVLNVEVFDMTGRLMDAEFDGNSVLIDRPGTYLLRIRAGTRICQKIALIR